MATGVLDKRGGMPTSTVKGPMARVPCSTKDVRRAMRFAYADPPYIGQARRHYDCAEIDHAELIRKLVVEFPDGWALSASSPTLKTILPMCPDRARIGAWVKSFCAFKKGVRPAYAWEPVIFVGGRNTNPPVPEKGGKQITPKDFHVAPITLRKGLVGAKPPSVCAWILDLLNAQRGDEIVDLFPGSGVMGGVAGERHLSYAVGEQSATLISREGGEL